MYIILGDGECSICQRRPRQMCLPSGKDIQTSHICRMCCLVTKETWSESWIRRTFTCRQFDAFIRPCCSSWHSWPSPRSRISQTGSAQTQCHLRTKRLFVLRSFILQSACGDRDFLFSENVNDTKSPCLQWKTFFYEEIKRHECCLSTFTHCWLVFSDGVNCILRLRKSNHPLLACFHTLKVWLTKFFLYVKLWNWNTCTTCLML